MIIEVDCYEQIEESFCDAFDLVPEYLREKASDILNEANKDNSWTDGDILIAGINEFIDREIDCDSLDELYVCHLTRLLTPPKELIPLTEVLLGDTSMSRFLASYGVSFLNDNGALLIKYKGKVIPREAIYEPNSMSNYCALASRLGYFESRQDFCVNGFAFRAGIENDRNGYFRALQDGPEILRDLDGFLGTKLMDEFKRQSKYYIAYMRVPFQKIMFDSDENLGLREKKKRFVRECIKYLISYYEAVHRNNSIPIATDAPLIRFKDDESVKVDHYEIIEEEH